MDRLESMKIFVKVVEGGSLSAASRKLNVPLATISRKVSGLESHLKIKLLVRTTRHLELTDGGRIYLASCQRILEEVASAERVATGEYTSPKGNLTITAPVVFGKFHILPIVTDFLMAYPEIDIRLILSDRVVDMIEERVDVAVRMGKLTDSSNIAKEVGVIREVVCASPAYFKKHGLPKKLEDLSKHNCVTFDRLGEASEWSFQKGKITKTIQVHSRLTVSSSEAAMEAAISGIGLTRVLSYQVLNHLKTGKLLPALVEHESDGWPVSLIFPGGRSLPLKLRAFLDFATPRLKKTLLLS
jgi:DNA-binding transcriptional LysR family regulator